MHFESESLQKKTILNQETTLQSSHAERRSCEHAGHILPKDSIQTMPWRCPIEPAQRFKRKSTYPTPTTTINRKPSTRTKNSKNTPSASHPTRIGIQKPTSSTCLQTPGTSAQGYHHQPDRVPNGPTHPGSYAFRKIHYLPAVDNCTGHLTALQCLSRSSPCTSPHQSQTA